MISSGRSIELQRTSRTGCRPGWPSRRWLRGWDSNESDAEFPCLLTDRVGDHSEQPHSLSALDGRVEGMYRLSIRPEEGRSISERRVASPFGIGDALHAESPGHSRGRAGGVTQTTIQPPSPLYPTVGWHSNHFGPIMTRDTE